MILWCIRIIQNKTKPEKNDDSMQTITKVFRIYFPLSITPILSYIHKSDTWRFFIFVVVEFSSFKTSFFTYLFLLIQLLSV